ncbi:PLP-dependent transferase [Phellopilus nigrolimitatus]|nr:PLP-dependent transferase [Phellopilus nigrolimitatus]
MSQGAPGISPPAKLLDALGKCAGDPKSCGYCPMTGEPLLRTALAQEMSFIYGEGSDIVPEDVALTAGCNMAFTTAVMAVAAAGDEVILPIPWYFNHEMTLHMLGISAIPLQTASQEGFLPSSKRCAELITPKTKAIVLVSPNNPTGAIYPPSLISSFALLARQHDIALIMDETYRDFITNGVPHHLFIPGSLQLIPDLPTDWTWRRHFIHLFSFSKSYCIPGHRLGAIVAPVEVLEQVKTVLDCIQICAPRHVQLALYPLLPELRCFISETAQSLVHRHDLFKSLLPRAWKLGSQGGYYAFVKHPFKGVSATDVSRRLAIESGIVTLPTSFFMPKGTQFQENSGDVDKWIRFSVANVDDDKVRRVCERLHESESEFGWDMEQGE